MAEQEGRNGGRCYRNEKSTWMMMSVWNRKNKNKR